MTHFRCPDDVAVVRASTGEVGPETDTVYLSHLPHGSLMVLQGTGAMIWEEAVATAGGSTEDDLVHRLAARVGLPPADIDGDVRTFVELLMEQGLLEPS